MSSSKQSGLPIAVSQGSFVVFPPLHTGHLEHFHQSCSNERNSGHSGLFDFWLRFGSVTGFFKPAPSPKPRQKPKILAAHRYIFSVNALTSAKSRPHYGNQNSMRLWSKI